MADAMPSDGLESAEPALPDAAAVPLPDQDPWQEPGQDPWHPAGGGETGSHSPMPGTGSSTPVGPTGQPVTLGPSAASVQLGQTHATSEAPMTIPGGPPGLLQASSAAAPMTMAPTTAPQGMMSPMGPCSCQGSGWMMPQGMVAPHTTPFGACLGVPPNGFTAHHMPPTPCMGYPTMPWSTFPWAWPPHPMPPAPVSSALTAQTAQQPIQGPPATSGTGSWSKPASVQGPQTKQSAPETPEDEDLDDSSSAQTSEIRSMLRQRMKKEGDGYQRPKSSLGSVRIEEYWGERSRYVKWKRTIQAQQCLYGLESQELAMLIYLSTRREARDVVEQHPVTSYTGAGGLHLLWRVLDEAFGESEAELFERADKELEKYRRAPGESIAHYLAEMRRLRAQYTRVDPDTKLSDRAWAQKLLHKASLSRKDRYDVYYSAGATYDPIAIEKALRVRCQKTHEDERRTPSRTPHRERGEREREDDGKVSVFKKKKIFIKKRVHGAHVAEGLEDEDEEESPAAMEQEPHEEEEVGDQPPDDEEAAEDDEDNRTSDGEMEEGELKEAFAAGWKAKQKVADFKKQRGWKATDKKGEKGASSATIDARKKATTCSSCGRQGHWPGDPECVNVINGRDQPHHKKTSMVHFTYMVSSGDALQCPQCHWPSKFCGECGCALHPDQRMSGQSKRSGEDDEWEEVKDDRFAFSVKKTSIVGAKPKAKAKSLVLYLLAKFVFKVKS